MATEHIVRNIARGWVVWCLVVFAAAAVIGCCGVISILSLASALTQ